MSHAHLVAALPRVLQALSEGLIDRARAIKFAECCADLSAEQSEVLLDEVLPEAGAVSATGLREKIKQVAIALDPAWAQRRYDQAVREQKVVGYLNADGSATLAGQNLPADEAALAGARVDALADAAKRAGAKAKIDMLRATIFLGLLDGRFHHKTRQAIIGELVRQFPKQPPPDERPAAEPAAAAAANPQPRNADAEAPGVHLRIGLGTLLGLDDQPGEVAGWGSASAAVARRLAARQRRSEWRFAILDTDGRWLFDGITRRRPRPRTDRRPRPGSRVSGGIVELHVPLSLLTDPNTATQHPEWAGILTDLAGQYTRQAPIEQDPAARFAGRPLRRRQQTRFPRCLFPGCRRPASDCDLDHRREYASGGVTDGANLGPGCNHDHELKTSRGWRLIRRDEITYVWISPLGRKHVVTIDPIAPPLPKPIPRLLPPGRDYPDGPYEPGPTFQPLDQRGRPIASALEPVSAPAIESDPDPPPF